MLFRSDARADRSPGEFYQLDIEMSFVEQEDIFTILEKLMNDVFSQFSKKKVISKVFPRISYDDALLKYGTDKPDLRNPLMIYDTTDLFLSEEVKFEIFKKLIKQGSLVRAIKTTKTSEQARSFFDGIDKWAKGEFETFVEMACAWKPRSPARPRSAVALLHAAISRVCFVATVSCTVSFATSV